MISRWDLSSLKKDNISDPMELEENESPDPGLKINPVSLVAMFFLNRIKFKYGSENIVYTTNDQSNIKCLVQKFLEIILVLLPNWDVYFFIEDDPVSFDHFYLVQVDNERAVHPHEHGFRQY